MRGAFAGTRRSVEDEEAWTWYAENLWTDAYPDMDAWAEAFNRRAAGSDRPFRRILVGYSLGGRLALHAVLNDPGLWAGVAIVAADPGKGTPAEKKKQLERDRRWAARLLNEPWDAVMADWEQLPVFQGRKPATPRAGSEKVKDVIAHAFEAYSKGRQRDLIPWLEGVINPPILYISGEADAKYRAIGEELQGRCPAVRHVSVQGAGHRVPWEAPGAFLDALMPFIVTIAAA